MPTTEEPQLGDPDAHRADLAVEIGKAAVDYGGAVPTMARNSPSASIRSISASAST